MAQRSPYWVRFADKKAVMALRWANKHCTFLDDDNRCTIYEQRPVTCRQHPLNIELSDTGALQRLSMSRTTPCPHDWTGNLQRRDLVALVRWNDQQSDQYLTKVKEWNRHPPAEQTRPAFLRFLGFRE
jgi:Fe-S-cluster containining protein